MAHKKGLGSSKNGRDSRSWASRLLAASLSRWIDHRPAAWHPLKPGVNVRVSKDDTLFAKVTGVIEFRDRGRQGKFISVRAAE